MSGTREGAFENWLMHTPIVLTQREEDIAHEAYCSGYVSGSAVAQSASPEAAWRGWYEQTYGADYPNGTEFDSGEMYEAFAAGWAAALPALTARHNTDLADGRREEREACARLADDRKATWQPTATCTCTRGTHQYPVGPPVPFADLIRAWDDQ